MVVESDAPPGQGRRHVRHPRRRDYDGLLRLGLSVTGERARALYRSQGFVPFGVEPQSIKHGDVEYMTLDLRSA